jgi:pimeloyl-ACP methyl ester carboxylesterase
MVNEAARSLPMTAKIPLILLPGLICDRALFAPQIAALADIAEPTVADLTRDDSLPAMATRVLAEAPPRFALAGLSMGGYLAQEIMRQAPERVLRLALLDTSARADTPERAQQRRDFIALAQRGEFKGITPRLLPQWIHPDHLQDEALTREVMAMTQRVGRDAYLRQMRAIMGRPDGRADLQHIRVPTLVLCGRQDQATPLRLHEELAGLIPRARLAVIARCGHLSTMEQPDAVNAELRRWLIMEEWEFWDIVERRINRVLDASRKKNTRFLTLDGIIPDMPSPASRGESLLGTVWMLSDNGGSFRFRLILSLNSAAAAAYRAGEFSKLLPDPDADSWFVINTQSESIRVTFAL